MKRIPSILILGYVITLLQLYGQEKPDSLVTPAELEGALEEITRDAEDSQLLEMLTLLREDPLDPNTATPEALQQIPGLTSLLAWGIVRYRSQSRFERLDDLLLVAGMDKELLDGFRPFLRIQPASFSSALPSIGSVRFRSRVSQDLQRRKGFSDGVYQGSPQKLYHRLILRSTDLNPLLTGRRDKETPASWIESGLVVEKDAGERSWDDFTAGYFIVNLPVWGSRVILGDYIVEAGEGMVFWRSVGFSKGSEVISTIQKNGGGIKPYASTDENNFFRGVAVEASVWGFRSSLFFSRKRLHASLSDEGILTGFNSTGLFRTEAEQHTKNVSAETLVGGILSAVPTAGLKFGVAGYRTVFNHPVMLGGIFGFRGGGSSVLGVNASWTARSSSLFSEIARDHDGTVAGVAGITWKPVRILDLALIGRMYPRDFTSLHSFGFGEGGGATQNESGLYVGVRVRPFKGTVISSYFDQFVSPWRTSLLRLPTEGKDALLLLQFRVTNKISLTLQTRHKQKEVTEASPDWFGIETRKVGRRSQEHYRATIELNPSITLRWRTRVECTSVGYDLRQGNESGLLAFQDVRMYPFAKLLVNFRIIAFHTDSFDSRLYEYESDPPGTMNNPALFGKGYRWYITGRYELSSSLDIWFKYGHTVKEGVKVLGSGQNEIKGDLDNRVSIQLDALL